MKHTLYRFCLLIAALLLVVGCTPEQQKPPQKQQPTTKSTAASSPAMETDTTADAENRVAKSQSDRLGTQWGEGIDSHVTTVDLRRVTNTALDVMQIYYAASRQSGRSIKEAMIVNGRIGVSILTDNDAKWPLTQDGSQIHLKGRKGERYQLAYRNYSNKTYEIVATVDGVDVLNGSAGSLSNKGYVLEPNSTLTIEGFRKSSDEVAAFRFADVADAYAANTPSGDARNTGVIGTAVFELRAPPVLPALPAPQVENMPQPFPSDSNGYAPPPKYNN